MIIRRFAVFCIVIFSFSLFAGDLFARGRDGDRNQRHDNRPAPRAERRHNRPGDVIKRIIVHEIERGIRRDNRRYDPDRPGYSRDHWRPCDTRRHWYVDRDYYYSRNHRLNRFYGRYLHYPRPLICRRVYNDPFNNWLFWVWLFDHSRDEQALWIYHHRHEFDPARYYDLCWNDPNLERRLMELEQMNVRPDPSYVPYGLESEDLMVGDDAVSPLR